MTLYLRLVSVNLRTINSLNLNYLKTWTERSLKCWYSSSVGQKPLTIQDIKRKAFKNLNVTQDLRPNSLKKIIIYENPKDYRTVALISLFNYLLWVYLVNFCLFWYVREFNVFSKDKSEDKSHQKKEKSIFEKLKTKKNFLILSGVSICLGHIILIVSMLFTTRTVHYIKLIPSSTGVDKVRIYCYSVFGLPNNVHKHEVPLQHISAQRLRASNKSRYIPLKIKGKTFKFLVDTKGDFSNPSLFDETVGVFRTF